MIPMHPTLTERRDAVAADIERESTESPKEHHAQLGMLKDIHRDFPADDERL